MNSATTTLEVASAPSAFMTTPLLFLGRRMAREGRALMSLQAVMRSCTAQAPSSLQAVCRIAAGQCQMETMSRCSSMQGCTANLTLMARSLFVAANKPSLGSMAPSAVECRPLSVDTSHLGKSVSTAGSLLAEGSGSSSGLLVEEEADDEEGVLPYRGSYSSLGTSRIARDVELGDILDDVRALGEAGMQSMEDRDGDAAASQPVFHLISRCGVLGEHVCGYVHVYMAA